MVLLHKKKHLFRDVSRYMKQHNILGSSRGYIERVVQSFQAVKVTSVQKYFLNTLKFANLYMEGESVYTVNDKVKKLRQVHKGHRGAAEFTVDHTLKVYNRNRLNTV